MAMVTGYQVKVTTIWANLLITSKKVGGVIVGEAVKYFKVAFLTAKGFRKSQEEL